MPKPDYGQDAPAVVRGLTIAGVILLIAAFVAHGLPRKLGIHPQWFWQPAAALLATAMWMVWSSRIGKQRKIRALLDSHTWRGDEIVLDIGCGRGLATIAVGHRVPEGRVTGIDLWRSRDLSGNTLAAAQENVAAARLGPRVSFQPGDATALPFADAMFDVVVSMTVLHNIPSASGRGKAVDEALRVLHPGGTLLIFDILHTPKYAAAAKSAGARHVWLSNPAILWALPGWSIKAEKASPADVARRRQALD